MFWEILGIEPTRDKKEITRAYREKLANTNPEDKPEEFKELRNAYEEALKYADESSGLMTEKKPVDHWLDKLEELYADFPRRNSVEEWQKLFSDDVCIPAMASLGLPIEVARDYTSIGCVETGIPGVWEPNFYNESMHNTVQIHL